MQKDEVERIVIGDISFYTALRLETLPDLSS